jgi:hypothetical protein
LANEIIQRDENFQLSISKKDIDKKGKSQFQMVKRNLEKTMEANDG